MTSLPTPAYRRRLRRRLLGYYQRSKRDLPWRMSSDPYVVWVSEVMLQQTQVSSALPYFHRWMARFPTLESLAAAGEDDVLHAWQGLGYYRRARLLRAAAKRVLARHGGQVPRDPAQLRELPGVGRYSAAAIASIAFGHPVAVVDGNVRRVLARLFRLRESPSAGPLGPRLWRLAEHLLPARHAGRFNQAMMDLGATICTPRAPRCGDCPLRPLCRAAREGVAEKYPQAPNAPPMRAVQAVAGLLRRQGRWLVVRPRAARGRWAGLWQFPNTECRPGESAEAALRRAFADAVGLAVRVGNVQMAVKHSVTRFRIHLEAHLCTARRGRASPKGVDELAWKRGFELSALAMPAPHRRIANWVAKVTPVRRG